MAISLQLRFSHGRKAALPAHAGRSRRGHVVEPVPPNMSAVHAGRPDAYGLAHTSLPLLQSRAKPRGVRWSAGSRPAIDGERYATSESTGDARPWSSTSTTHVY